MTKIKNLHPSDRPEEKLLRYGPEKLDDTELLALILRTGFKGVNVKTLSGRILKEYKKDKDNFTLEKLQAMKGIGATKSAQVLAVIELGKRLLQNKQYSLLLNASDVWQRSEDFRGSKREHFVVFFLNVRNQEIKREIVSIGTLNASLVHPREVFESAIKESASAIIAVHNHPSGNTTPSPEDLAITNRLKEAGELLGIKLLDHIIVTKEDFRSLL